MRTGITHPEGGERRESWAQNRRKEGILGAEQEKRCKTVCKTV